jgi:hypothetical protein
MVKEKCICFQNGVPKSIRSIGLIIIISLLQFWCKNLNADLVLKLNYMIPQDV